MREITFKISLGAAVFAAIAFVYCSGLWASVLKPIEVSQGEVFELKVSGVGLTTVEGMLGKRRIIFYPDYHDQYGALVGIDLESKPRLTNVIIKGTTSAGAQKRVQIPLNIKAKSFPQESFVVAAEFDDLGPEVLDRIRREQAQLEEVFSVSAPKRLWELPFILPVPGEMTSAFGYRRIINGIPRAPHTGVDLRALLGSDVLAANHGRIALMGEFFYSGKTIVLDHGCGLYTMYFHLSEFNVEKGAEVRKGEIIGLSGMTGRVTGPHLHWGARLNGARVDPFDLIQKFTGKVQPAAGADLNIR